MKNPLRLLAALLFLIPVVLPAQEKAARSCRILYLNAPSGAPSTLQLYDGKTAREVALPAMNFSPLYRLPEGDLTLHLLPSAPATPEEIPAGAPAAQVPAAVKNFYLMVTTDDANPVAPVAMQVVELDFDRFAAGGILWFNLTPVSIAGKVGSQALSLAPGSRQMMGAPATGKEDYAVDLAYRLKPGDPIHPICETTWLHDPRSRKVAFIFGEKGRPAPRVLAFNDFRPES
ncbi:hypothetical protein [Haloferula sargassicola]|uniref:DUF4397 domain-containing protein n=1 Tax=Haloferula sargassicola TaxID=490096 RepID=A0ABP9UKQ7_9BACT